jgi:hypothetical protein
MILLRSEVDGCWSDANRPLPSEFIVMEVDVFVASRRTAGTMLRAPLRHKRRGIFEHIGDAYL